MSVGVHGPRRRDDRGRPTGRSSGRSRTSAASTSRRRRSPRPAPGTAEFTTERPARRDGDDRRSVRCPSRRTRRLARRRGAGGRHADRSPTSAATSRRSRPTEARSGASTRRRWRTRSPRRSRSCSSSRRRSSARPRPCGPTLDRIKPVAAAHPDVTFINVEPYQLKLVDGQLQPVLTPTASSSAVPTPRRVRPPDRAVGLRRRRRRDGQRVVRAGLRARGDRGRGPGAGVTLGPSAALRRVLDPDGDELAALVAERRPGSGEADACARRGGRAGTRRRSPGRRSGTSTVRPSAVRIVKPWTSVRLGRLDGDDDAGLDLPAGAAEDRRGADRDRDQPRTAATRTTSRPRPVRPAHRLEAETLTRPGPAAPRRVERRAVGAARAGLGARLVGRQVELPERAERVDPAGRWARSASFVPPPLRSTRTTHSTISPPIASTAGSIARSEPPVVRMSSTRRTRSPGSIRKPRRNSRRVAPSAARTSSAKIARTPSWRPVSKARITPPVVGPATRSTRGASPSSSPRGRAAQKPHSSLVAAGSDRTANFST